MQQKPCNYWGSSKKARSNKWECNIPVTYPTPPHPHHAHAGKKKRKKRRGREVKDQQGPRHHTRYPPWARVLLYYIYIGQQTDRPTQNEQNYHKSLGKHPTHLTKVTKPPLRGVFLYRLGEKIICRNMTGHIPTS